MTALRARGAVGPTRDGASAARRRAGQALLNSLLRWGAALPLPPPPPEAQLFARNTHSALELASVAEETVLCENFCFVVCHHWSGAARGEAAVFGPLFFVVALRSLSTQKQRGNSRFFLAEREK